MSSLPNIAIIGATGSLGSVVLKKVLAAGFPVTILTRQGSKSTSTLPQHANQTIKEVDYSSKESLTSALKGTQVIVSTVTSGKTGDQELLIDAAVETGTVTRFIPSDFGSDIHHPKNVDLPVYAGKHQTSKYLKQVVKTHPNFTYTEIQNNAFLDWGISKDFLINLTNHTATLWDGGDVPFSTTTLSTVGDAVVAVIKDLDGTANKVVKVHDGVVSQNELIEMIKKVDGKEWNTTVKSVKQTEEEAWTEWKKSEGKSMQAIFGFLVPAIYGEGRAVYSSQVDNKKLGIKEMSKAEIQEEVRKVVQGQ